MTINLDGIAADIAAIVNKLDDVSDRKALIAKISAASIGGQFTSVDAAASGRMTLVAAAAKYPHRVNLIKQLQARARRLGYDLKDDKPVDPVELDRALAGKDVDARFALKTDMRAVGLL
jgi:hypothetical protein